MELLTRVEKLFINAGRKIQKLALIAFIVEIIASIIGACVMFFCCLSWGGDFSCFISGLMFLIVGPFVSYLNSALIYGFGLIIEKYTTKKSDK
ncbi:MAG: hypothetical protein HFJ98_00095 [Eubacterium sp.]|nr:hypothetical protein [Eubacterium sp.]